MSERTPCTRCGRAIDQWSKICPFCNWDQAEPLPAVQPPKPAAVANYRPPAEFDWKKQAMFAGIGILVLVAAFGVGMVINQDGAPDEAPLTVEEQQEAEAAQRKAGTARRADTPLVPTNEAGGVEQAITSAPVAAQPGAAPDAYNRTDATAVSAVEYAEIAKRARAEKEQMAMIDPRSLTGPAYAQGAPVPIRRRPTLQSAQRLPAPAAAPQNGAAVPLSSGAPPAAAPAPPPVAPRASNESARTRPVPIHQPLPRIAARGSARLQLMVGADGRVQNISISQPLAGGTGALVAAVQNWRFRPATENGQPVAAPYTVEISFNR